MNQELRDLVRRQDLPDLSYESLGLRLICPRCMRLLLETSDGPKKEGCRDCFPSENAWTAEGRDRWRQDNPLEDRRQTRDRMRRYRRRLKRKRIDESGENREAIDRVIQIHPNRGKKNRSRARAEREYAKHLAQYQQDRQQFELEITSVFPRRGT